MKDDDQLLTHVTCLETALTVDNDHAHFDRPSKIPTTLQQCDRLPPAGLGLPRAGRHARERARPGGQPDEMQRQSKNSSLLKESFDRLRDAPDLNWPFFTYASEMGIIGDQNCSGVQAGCSMNDICTFAGWKERLA